MAFNFHRFVQTKNIRLKVSISDSIDEKFASSTYDCMRFIDSVSIICLDVLPETLKEEGFVITRKVFGDRGNSLKKLVYLYGGFEEIIDYDKPKAKLKKD